MCRLYTVYTVLCAGLYTVYIVLCTGLYTVYTVLCAGYILYIPCCVQVIYCIYRAVCRLYTVYTVLCAGLYTVYIVLCTGLYTVYTVLCAGLYTVYTVLCAGLYTDWYYFFRKSNDYLFVLLFTEGGVSLSSSSDGPDRVRYVCKWVHGCHHNNITASWRYVLTMHDIMLSRVTTISREIKQR